MPRKPDLTYFELFSSSGVIALIAGYFMGSDFGIFVFILFLFLGLPVTTYQHIKYHYGTGKKSKSQNSDERYKPRSYRKTSSLKVIDQIQFEYTPEHGESGIYTVDVVKGLRGNLEGYCIEREDVRTFRPDRIVNSQVVRTSTGEVLSLKEWRGLFRRTNS